MIGITLLSDFGLHDASAGVAKGVLLSNIQNIRITDISHEISPFQVKQAAYLLGTAYKNFAKDTIHIVFIDVFSETLPRLVLSSFNGHYFLAPDNGILPLALGMLPQSSWLCFELSSEKSFGDWLLAIADTINLLQKQNGVETTLQPCILKTINTETNNKSGGATSCEVLYIDHYGNVVTDMTAAYFNDRNNSGRFRINFMRVNEITTISNHYNDVALGDNLCRFNRNGYLEICVNQGSAASLFGFRLGGKHNEIKISFE